MFLSSFLSYFEDQVVPRIQSSIMMSVIALFEFILEAMLYYLCIFASIENELFSLFSNYCVDP